MARSQQCAASGGCRAAAPTVFGKDEDGWVRVIDPHPSPDLLEDVLEARDSCPMAVIDVYDAKGVSLV
ncbi:ferredoxin [Nocardioides sp. AE5]|uniref:ferredoxin n=1 Tax=Nocardioides sp. AE5 TaxID=2962573 RepID=UPI002882B37D|nr:ferredoxin [Nocardioides sp. AE5]MDT0202611.1 ferredoxin [Nocardioides sp. AE5]